VGPPRADTKGMGAVVAVVLIALKRAGVHLRGDVVFLGTADEEASGRKGAGFLVDRHWDLVKDAGVVLNEGGSINRDPRCACRAASSKRARVG
jgi:acetylornithine deacetylase/succinyl-diaminopimelate desuccinylase-like protein